MVKNGRRTVNAWSTLVTCVAYARAGHHLNVRAGFISEDKFTSCNAFSIGRLAWPHGRSGGASCVTHVAVPCPPYFRAHTAHNAPCMLFSCIRSNLVLGARFGR